MAGMEIPIRSRFCKEFARGRLDPGEKNYSKFGCPYGDDCTKGMHGPEGFIAFECENEECTDQYCKNRHSNDQDEIERSAKRQWEYYLDLIGDQDSVEYTRLCTHYCTKECKFPDSCRFAHGLGKTQQFASVKTIGEAREAYNTIIGNFKDDCLAAQLKPRTINIAVAKLEKEFEGIVKKLSPPRLPHAKARAGWGVHGPGYTQGSPSCGPQPNRPPLPAIIPPRAGKTDNFVITPDTPMFIIPDFRQRSLRVYLSKDYELPTAFATDLRFTDLDDKPFKVAEVAICGASTDLLLAVEQYLVDPTAGVPSWWITEYGRAQE